LDRQEREALAYLIEENRVLRAQLGSRRLRLTDDERRCLAVRTVRLGRQALRQVATIVNHDTLRWHWQLTPANGYPRWVAAARPSHCDPSLGRRDGEDNPTWGHTRIQGALKNVEHRIGRSTWRGF